MCIRRNACCLARDSTRAMARRHVERLKELDSLRWRGWIRTTRSSVDKMQMWRRGGGSQKSPHRHRRFRAEAGPLGRRAHQHIPTGSALRLQHSLSQAFHGRCPGVWESVREARVSSAAAPQRGDLCAVQLELLRAQPVAKAVLWRAAPAERSFRFVIVPLRAWAGTRQLVSSMGRRREG